MLAQREKLEEVRDLVTSEPGFLEQGKMLERNKALLTAVLGK